VNKTNIVYFFTQLCSPRTTFTSNQLRLSSFPH